MSVFTVFRFFTLCMGFLGVYFDLVLAIDVSMREGEASIFLDVCIDSGQVVYKDSVRFFFDDPNLEVVRFDFMQEATEEYLAPLKVHKKVYREPFCIKVFVDGLEDRGSGCSLCFSCFVVEDNEAVRPFKKYLLLSERQGSVGTKHDIAKIKSHEDLSRPIFKRIDRSFWLLNSRILLYLLLLVLLIGFIIVNILKFGDIAMLVLLLAWFFVIRNFLNYLLMLICSVFLMVFSAIWFLRDGRRCPVMLRRIRLALGLVCASSIIPLLVKIYFYIFFGR